MADPERWLDSGNVPDEVRSLLANARPSRALDEATRRRSRRRLSGLMAMPAAAGVVFWLQHAAFGAALGVVVTSAVVAPRFIASWKAERAAAVPAPRAVPARAPTPSVSPPEPRGLSEAAPVDLPRPSSPIAKEPAEPLDLAQEARLLERARSLLAGSPAAALATLERHAAGAPHGTLELEREILEVDALLRLGRRREAEAKARQIRAHAPGSLYERRLAELLGER